MITALDHVQLAAPPGSEDELRAYYTGVLGMTELTKPPVLAARGGCWFDAGGLDIHLSVATDAAGDQRHFGLEVVDVDVWRQRLEKAGIACDPGRPAPWKRFFARDPFGNRIEF
ncbi:MAG TPA: VOC family protein, partial [Streptomyces sp.]